MPLTSICDAPGCHAVVTLPVVFCGVHWELLPADLRRALGDAWTPGTKTLAWRRALADAEAAICEREGNAAGARVARATLARLDQEAAAAREAERAKAQDRVDGGRG